MSIDRRLVNQTWAGDSHKMEHHLVPASYRKILAEREEDAVKFRQGPETENWLRSGLKITEDWTNKFCEMIVKNQGTPSCYVLTVSTNNLRDNPTSIEADNIVKNIKNIIYVVKNAQYAALCVVSPIPNGSGKTDHIQEYLDKELKKWCVKEGAETGAIKYVPFWTKKCPHHGGHTRFNPLFFKKDKLHLNLRGAEMLAKLIFDIQTTIPNSVFGMPNKDEISLPKKIKIMTGMTLKEFDDDLDKRLKAYRDATSRPPGSEPPPKKPYRRIDFNAN